MLVEYPELRYAYSALHGGSRIQSSPDRKSVLVTSTQPQEGKTTIASCLAITASWAGENVLIIDGDLRRPSLGHAAGISESIGLAEILDGQVEPADAIHYVDFCQGTQNAGRLSAISAG